MRPRRRKRGAHWVGTSGWTYRNWRGPFYPEDLKQADWLPYYAEHLASLELNASFYRLPPESLIKRLVEGTPKDFLVAIKGSRLISHAKRLLDCEQALKIFFGRIALFRGRAGPVLFQLPPRFPADPARLEAFLALLPKKRRFAFEFRDPSWHQDEIYALLRAQNAAFVLFELAKLSAPRVLTADFTYVRLHGRRKYKSAYSEAQLADWAAWLRAQMAEGRDVYAYFDNTDEADHAPRNAMRLNEMLSTA
jgi:uncharacterized protein YecE (DUF72 family)